ncbi:hypothetical protein MIR68_001909 [Amoeboaphelidium protococcarum]|nr:hypothetical protein MIR68_001909 [Amoeboaphelidium protococcarum]
MIKTPRQQQRASHGGGQQSSIRSLKGDWYCGECNMHNFARRTDCFRCHTLKDDAADTVTVEQQSGDSGDGAPKYSDGNATINNKQKYILPQGAQMKRGDWFCSKSDCRYLNFASRSHCNQCATPKSLMPDEWKCDCGFTNLKFRSTCFQCYADRPADISAPVPKEGEWMCESCNCFNFAKRRECFECGKSK